MKIQPNASPDEFLSPFYKMNEKFCKEFEYFIIQNKGEVKGNYNAYSYLIFGKITTPAIWVLKYKKATFSTTGNLWLSSKKQSLYVLAEWKTNRLVSSENEFIIKKKSFIDRFKIIFSSNFQTLSTNKKYLIKSNNPSSVLVKKVVILLEELFETKEIYQIKHKNDQLLISIHTQFHYFTVFNKIRHI